MDLTGARGRRLLRFLQYWLHLSLLRCLLLLHRLHQLLLELTLRLGQHSLLLDLVLARLENRAGRSRHLIAGFESGICLLKFELKLANLLIERVLLLLHFSFDRKHGLLALLDLSGVLALQILYRLVLNLQEISQQLFVPDEFLRLPLQRLDLLFILSLSLLNRLL